jgi:hypothetical protein
MNEPLQNLLRIKWRKLKARQLKPNTMAYGGKLSGSNPGQTSDYLC